MKSYLHLQNKKKNGIAPGEVQISSNKTDEQRVQGLNTKYHTAGTKVLWKQLGWDPHNIWISQRSCMLLDSCPAAPVLTVGGGVSCLTADHLHSYLFLISYGPSEQPREREAYEFTVSSLSMFMNPGSCGKLN